MSKQPPRTYCKRSRPLPYCNPNCRTPRHRRFTQGHRTTRPPPRVQLINIETYPEWLELLVTRTSFQFPKPVRATKVLLYLNYFNGESRTEKLTDKFGCINSHIRSEHAETLLYACVIIFFSAFIVGRAEMPRRAEASFRTSYCRYAR